MAKTAKIPDVSSVSGKDAKPRVPRRSLTRKALLDAARRLISTGRMETATIDDVIREADVARGSFYNHFPDIAALASFVRASVKEEFDAVVGAVTQGAEEPASRIIRSVLASFRFGMENQLSARVLLDYIPGGADATPTNNEALAYELQAGIDKGQFQLQTLDVGIILVLGLSDMGLSRLLSLQTEQSQAREIMREICVVMLRGLGVNTRQLNRIVTSAMEAVLDLRP